MCRLINHMQAFVFSSEASSYVSQADLQLAMQQSSLNSWQSCLYPPDAGITGVANTPSLCNIRNQTLLHPSLLSRFLFNPFCKLQYSYRQGGLKLRIFLFGVQKCKKKPSFTDSGLTSGLEQWPRSQGLC